MNKKFELVLLEYIKNNSKLPEHNKKENTKYSYYLKKLVDKGLIKRVGYGVWEVQKEVQTSSNFSEQYGHTTKETCRSHAYRFNIKLPYINSWDKRRTTILKNKPFKELPNGELLNIRKHNIYLYTDSIQITFKSKKYFLGTDPIINNGKAILELNRTLVAIQRFLHIPINFGKSFMIQCHHANIKNTLASYYRERGVNKWSVRDSKGEEWLLVDNSFNLLELETTHKVTATTDYKIVVEPLMNTLRDNPDILNLMKEQINQLSKENEELKKNMITMIEVQRDQTYIINQLINKNK